MINKFRLFGLLALAAEKSQSTKAEQRDRTWLRNRCEVETGSTCIVTGECQAMNFNRKDNCVCHICRCEIKLDHTFS